MKKVTTVSMDYKLLKQGRARAARVNRTFSNYIETLIRNDLADEKQQMGSSGDGGDGKGGQNDKSKQDSV